MRLVIVTGMSGAGRTTALKMLEDAGYFCVDNLPVPFIDKFAELTASGNSEITKVAIGIDIRSGKSLSQLEQILERLTAEHIDYEILFLDASDDVLVKRYKETRRMHPLAESGRVAPGIAEAIRAGSMAITKRAMLSRAVSAIRHRTLIINLPGSPKAVEESLGFVLDTLPHALGLLRGTDGECGRS